jgi:DNA-damage-inducible protein D
MMEEKQLKILFRTLDDVRHQNGTEYWYAKELFICLGYDLWESFTPVIERARIACMNSGGDVDVHFSPIERNDGVQTIDDIKLTRYAAYLIAVNGDPKKQEIAFAQAYFVSKTRQLEELQQHFEYFQRLEAREKLKLTEKEFGDMVFARGVDGPGIAKIKHRGDQELFGQDKYTSMKKFLKVPPNRAIADMLPTVTLKAKDLAAAMTIENARQKNLQGLFSIGTEHVQNNKSVRGALVQSGITPENIPPAEDIKAVESRHRKQLKELRQKQKEDLNLLAMTKTAKAEEDLL